MANKTGGVNGRIINVLAILLPLFCYALLLSSSYTSNALVVVVTFTYLQQPHTLPIKS